MDKPCCDKPFIYMLNGVTECGNCGWFDEDEFERSLGNTGEDDPSTEEI